MSLSPGESTVFVLLVPVNFRFALRHRTCLPYAWPSSSESHVADSHSCVHRICRVTVSDLRRRRRRCRRCRLREREEPRRAATLSDRLTNPSSSINQPAATASVVVVVTFLPPFIPLIGSDSLLATLVSATSRMCTIHARLHENFRVHVCALIRVVVVSKRTCLACEIFVRRMTKA